MSTADAPLLILLVLLIAMVVVYWKRR